MDDNSLFLGIDTSNYTTSVAVVTKDGIAANIKRLLTVKEGERGVRQSDAVFMHTVNLPELMLKAREYLANGKLCAIGVSDKPRNPEGSYMPCFLAGVNAAVTASACASVPLYRFSHQCGHIMAAICSSGAYHLLDHSFAAFHVSGGTTELVKVNPSIHGFETEIVGGTLDLNAGQVIDRIGVRMGLRFPCGPELERLALSCTSRVPSRKVSYDGTYVNLSGLENIATDCLNKTSDKALAAAIVLNYVADALSLMCDKYTEKYGESDFLFAGGVMSNSIIKNKLRSRYSKSYFAEPMLSADNAVGIASLARACYLNSKLR